MIDHEDVDHRPIPPEDRPVSLDHAFESFLDPPRELGLIPFWFWNDDLEEDELIRQLHAFHEAGFGGVMPHARVGLSRRVGYLTDEFFRLMRRVVEEAASLEMKVILYDEGSYPSGSACGAVVAENSDFASRGILLWTRDIEGPHSGFWRPNTGRAMEDRHVCTVLGRVDPNGRIEARSVERLQPYDHNIFKIDVADGVWKAMSVWDVASGGIIRGVYEDQEDGHATAPPAGNILDPEAVACFLQLTHDRYFEELSEYFGNTVIAMFTDEPSVLGKGSKRQGRDNGARTTMKPWTTGLDNELAERWDEDPGAWLPALWLDYDERTEAFRQRFNDTVQSRLSHVFYAAQSEWCERHGIELTGHPAESNDLSSLRLFQMPGQDMVWRYVEPDRPTAMEGAHSVAAKAATSGARLRNRRRILTEVCGAYGWGLTLDEVKWLFDWHLVRGNNLVNPHAVFYSIRERRAWESEPDLALHNVWWPYFPAIAHYARRVSWLLTDGEHICDVAILGDGNDLPWKAAKQLYERQIDFLYLDDVAVAGSSVKDGRLCVGPQQYRVVVVDDLPEMTENARSRLDAFAATGGTVIQFPSESALPEEIDRAVAPDVRLSPADPALRFMRYRKSGLDFYLLVNEGERPIQGELQLSLQGSVHVWDPLNAARLPVWGTSTSDGLAIDLNLERRETRVIAVDPSGTFSPDPDPVRTSRSCTPVDSGWVVKSSDGLRVFDRLGDWSRKEGWELFSGMMTYETDLHVEKDGRVELDLGRVGDIADVRVDGKPAGTRMWAPYRLDLGTLTAGRHQLEIRVTNSMANAYEGMQLPSGLMGPVTVEVET